jgi:SRSO17 transposase
MVAAAGTRWQIARTFAEARAWWGSTSTRCGAGDGWHRHVTLCALAHAALVVARACAVVAKAEKGGASGPTT